VATRTDIAGVRGGNVCRFVIALGRLDPDVIGGELLVGLYVTTFTLSNRGWNCFYRSNPLRWKVARQSTYPCGVSLRVWYQSTCVIPVYVYDISLRVWYQSTCVVPVVWTNAELFKPSGAAPHPSPVRVGGFGAEHNHYWDVAGTRLSLAQLQTTTDTLCKRPSWLLDGCPSLFCVESSTFPSLLLP
jgi:hypothetical protein